MVYYRGSFLLAALLLASPSQSFDLGVDDIYASGYMDGGRFQLADSALNGEIISRMGAKWNIGKEISDGWLVDAQLHLFFWRNQASDLGLFHIAGIKFDSDMKGTLSWRGGAHRFRGGVYDFKYNPDAKDLGEYLLRSIAYPTILESSQGKDLFDPALQRVLGAEYGLEYEYLRTKGLVFLEQHSVPVQDAGLAYFISFGPRAIEVEFGVVYERFLKFGDRYDWEALDPSYDQYLDNKDLAKNVAKVGARGRMDLGTLLEMNEDFGIYGEVALLGLKGDTNFYKDITQRMPAMVGLNIPTLGILTGLSLEAEYLKNPYLARRFLRTDVVGLAYSGLPKLDDFENPPSFYADDFRWSILIHKAFNNWLDLKVRCASNHFRTFGFEGDYYNSGEPLAKRSGDWVFLVRLEYHN